MRRTAFVRMVERVPRSLCESTNYIWQSVARSGLAAVSATFSPARYCGVCAKTPIAADDALCREV